MNSPAAASVRRIEDQRIRAEAGMSKLVIRLSTLHPIFASVRCVGRVPPRSRRPMMVLLPIHRSLDQAPAVVAGTALPAHASMFFDCCNTSRP